MRNDAICTPLCENAAIYSQRTRSPQLHDAIMYASRVGGQRARACWLRVDGQMDGRTVNMRACLGSTLEENSSGTRYQVEHLSWRSLTPRENKKGHLEFRGGRWGRRQGKRQSTETVVVVRFLQPATSHSASAPSSRYCFKVPPSGNQSH